MIEAMVSGKLIRDAELKVSGSGREYLLILASVADDQLCRCMLFGDSIEDMRRLKRGDAVALVGTLTVGIWNEKPSLSLMASRAISPAERRHQKARPKDTQAQFRAAAHAQRAGDDIGNDLPWGDE